MDFLQSEFHGYLMWQVIAAVVVGLVVLKILLKLLKGKENVTEKYSSGKICMDCRWKGKVSGKMLKCPKCGSDNLKPFQGKI